jgi:serine phosphatase RsbU (regulator of sigma subunit)
MGKLMVGADQYLPSGWSDALAAAFYRDLETGERQFPSAIEQLSRDLLIAGAPVRWFQEAISRIRGNILPGLPEGARARRAEDLLQQARLICADAAERQQLSRLMDAERATEVLADATRALVTSFEVPALRAALLTQLPRLGIRAAYLVLYEGSGEPAAKSRLVLAYDVERDSQDAGPDRLIDTEQLVPKDSLPERRTTLALMPLYFEELQIGAALFELGPENGVIYEALREVLSAALKGARLRGELALEAAQREQAERDRLSQELEIATRIQTSILPKNLQVEGLEIAAGMLPATEVGGDYYDVLPVPGGAWLGIGDVAGHGLRPGLVMVMLQSIVAAVVSHSPEIAPSEMVQIVNRVLYENVRQRLHQDEHATLSLMRYQRSGRVSFAGAHEDIVVYRTRTRRCETIVTPGTWVAATRDIAQVTVDSSLELARGDVLLLYTDGVIEAANAAGEPFGLERLCWELERMGAESIEAMRDQLLGRVTEWVLEQRDDIALLVARQLE